MKFALICVFAAMLVMGSVAQQAGDCPTVCPALWGPICAKNSEGVETSFDNECLMRAKNCNQKTDYAKLRNGNCS